MLIYLRKQNRPAGAGLWSIWSGIVRLKEGVSRTYKGYDGSAPMMAYIGAEGFMARCELREGKQHCQKNTSKFLRETLALCHQLTDKPLLVRMDAGNDAADNLGILIKDGDWFIIKRKLRQESKQEWFEKVMACCKDIRHPHEGKAVYVGASWKDIAYNILRMIGQESLKHKQADKRPVKRRRIRTVLSNLIQFASHITEHARKVFLGMGCSNTWRYAFHSVWLRFAC